MLTSMLLKPVVENESQKAREAGKARGLGSSNIIYSPNHRTHRKMRSGQQEAHFIRKTNSSQDSKQWKTGKLSRFIREKQNRVKTGIHL